MALNARHQEILDDFRTSLPALDPAPYARPEINPLPFVTVARIVSIAAEWYGLTWHDVTRVRRDQVSANCRQAIAFLARELTSASYPKIAEIMDRDHATVISNAKRAKDRIKAEKKFASDVAFIRSQVTGG